MLVFLQELDSVKINVKEPIAQVTSKLESWLDAFIDMLPNMLVAILLFIAFLLLAKLIKKVVSKIFRKTSDNKAVESLLTTIIYYTVIGLGLFIILGILHLDRAVTSLLAGIGVLGLALGFAFQDIAANFIAGIILAFRKPFKIGDIVDLEDYMGKVSRTNLRATVILTFQGQEVYIPNKEVLSNPIVNYSALGERRIDLTVGVSYGDELEKVKELVLDTIKNLEGVIRQDDMIFTYSEFGDSSINFDIKFWIKYPGNVSFLDMRSNAIIGIKAAFDKSDITIPFPIRTLDFGIKGGEKLSEMKINSSENTTNK